MAQFYKGISNVTPNAANAFVAFTRKTIANCCRVNCHYRPLFDAGLKPAAPSTAGDVAGNCLEVFEHFHGSAEV